MPACLEVSDCACNLVGAAIRRGPRAGHCHTSRSAVGAGFQCERPNALATASHEVAMLSHGEYCVRNLLTYEQAFELTP